MYSAIIILFLPLVVIGVDIIVLHMSPCDNEGTKELYLSNYKLYRPKRSGFPILNSSLYTKYPFDDDLGCEMIVSVLSNNGYKANYYRQKLPKACSSLKAFIPQTVNQIMKSANVKNCPIPPGNHSFSMELKISINIPFVSTGKYRADFEFSKNGKLVGCYRAFVESRNRN